MDFSTSALEYNVMVLVALVIAISAKLFNSLVVGLFNKGPSQERWIKHGRSTSYGDLKIEKKKETGKKKNTTYPLIFHASRMYEIVSFFLFFSVLPNLYIF